MKRIFTQEGFFFTVNSRKEWYLQDKVNEVQPAPVTDTKHTLSSQTNMQVSKAAIQSLTSFIWTFKYLGLFLLRWQKKKKKHRGRKETESWARDNKKPRKVQKKRGQSGSSARHTNPYLKKWKLLQRPQLNQHCGDDGLEGEGKMLQFGTNRQRRDLKRLWSFSLNWKCLHMPLVDDTLNLTVGRRSTSRCRFYLLLYCGFDCPYRSWTVSTVTIN